MEDILSGITEFFDQILAFFSMIGDFISHMFSALGDLLKFIALLPSVFNMSSLFVPSFIAMLGFCTIAIALCVRLFGGGGG